MRTWLLVLLSVGSLAQADKHAEVEPTSPGTSTVSTVEPPTPVCEDVAAGVCSQSALHDSLSKGQAVQQDLKNTVNRALEKIHGGNVEGLVVKSLAEKGFSLKPDLPESAKRDALSPPRLRSSSANENLDAFDLKLTNCETDLSPGDMQTIHKDLKNLTRDERLPSNLTTFDSTEFDGASKLKMALAGSNEHLRLAIQTDEWDRKSDSKEKVYSALVNYLSFEAHALYTNYSAPLYSKLDEFKAGIAEFNWLCEGFRRFRNVEQPAERCDEYFFISEQQSVNSIRIPLWITPLDIAKERNKYIDGWVKQLSSADNAESFQEIWRYLESPPSTGSAVYQIGIQLWNDLQAAEGQKAKEELARAAVVSYLDAIKKDNAFSKFVDSIQTEYAPQAEAKIQDKLLCYARRKMLQARINSTDEDIYGNINISRPVVEAVTNYFYTPETRKFEQDVFAQVKTAVGEVVQEKILPHLSDAKVRDRVESSFKELGLNIPATPEHMAFKKDDKLPVEILDFDEIDETDSFYQSFLDPKLGALSDLNAFYNPEASQITGNFTRSINLLPGSLKLFHEKPYAVMAVLAHEIGHHFDPFVSRALGYDLRKAMSPVLNCLKTNDSIKMEPFQAGESIADWISAEAMAKILSQLPPSEQKEKTIETLSFFCTFFMTDPSHHRDDPHPSDYRRIDGIFGAQPMLRKLLGCDNPGPFKYCGIDGGS